MLPKTDNRCSWWDRDDSAMIGRRLEGVQAVDCLIVGAGNTGLACAARLAELRNDWKIALVDGLKVGQTASGRNSGYVVDTGHYRKEWGVEGNQAHNRICRHGIERIQSAVTTFGIDCDWHAGDRFHVCASDRGEAELKAFEKGLDRMTEPYEQLSRIELEDRIGTSYYRWGLALPGGALVNPTKLVRGLARHLPENVWLFEETPIEAMTPGRRWTAETRNGRVEADRVVFATNGFSGAWGLSKNRLLPFMTYASVTAPLERAPGRLEQWGVVSEEKMGSTVRITADRRLLVRWGVSFKSRPDLGGSVLERMKDVHRRSFEKRFPQLAGVPFTHTWGGVLGVTNNGGSRFGAVANNAWVCAGHNGVGIAIGAGLGDLIAHQVAGADHPRIADTRFIAMPAWLPPQPFLGIGISLYTAFLAWLAGEEV